MKSLSSRQVAARLGLTGASLSRYIKAGKIPAPKETRLGGMLMRLWSESDIERLRKALPKIKNGRKTRYKKKKKQSQTKKKQN